MVIIEKEDVFFRLKDSAYNSFSFYFSGGNILQHDSVDMEKNGPSILMLFNRGSSSSETYLKSGILILEGILIPCFFFKENSQ